MFEKLNAIDIGTYNTKFVSGRQGFNQGSLEVSSADMVRTPAGAIKDGSIIDPQALANALREQIDKLKRHSKDTVITTSSSRVIIRDIVVPKVGGGDLKRMMQMDATTHLPVSRDDHIIDYKVIEEIAPKGKGEVPQYKVMLVAVPVDILNGYAEFLRYCGLQCYSIDFAGNSLSKQIADEMKDKNLTTAIIDIGHKTTTATMMTNGKFQFYRIFPCGGETMTKAIAKKLGVSMDVAENLKKEHGVICEDESGQTGENMEVSMAIKQVLDPFMQELSSYFEFYISREAGNSIDKIVLVGGGSLVSNIEDYMMKSSNILVRKHKRRVPFDKNRKVDKKKMERSELADIGIYFANCLGALK
jgi:type IV pilus assembly protein PilM